MSSNLINQLEFHDFELNSRLETAVSLDKTEKFLIKVQIIKNPKKNFDVIEEFKVIKHLNDNGCKSCPTAYELGTVAGSYLTSRGLSSAQEDATYDYIIQEYVKNSGAYNMADLLLSLIEQKKLGVYQGDVKPDNVRFNQETGICVFIDYDQSIMLTQEQRNMNNIDFLNFCDEYDKQKYGFGNWLRHYPNINNEYALKFLVDGSLNLAYTTLIKLQKTTNSESGIYHTIDSKDVFMKGSRGISTRAELLDSVDFKQGERVLDVGCNAGLLSEYLHDRGCTVTGVDNDYHITVTAKLISNILGRKISYDCVDLDLVDELPQFDSIMLFSVFHHTRNIEKNALKIAKSCNRIIIETRLIESGKQPVGNTWVDTTKWKFDSLEELTNYLETLFKGFKFTSNVGSVDKGRYILELKKSLE